MKTLVVLSFIASMSAWAGHETGNGGDAVVCRDPQSQITSAEPLDVFEARVLRGIELRLEQRQSLEQAYDVLLQRLAVSSPIRAARYRSFLARFVAERRLLDVTLIDIPDSEHLVFPNGCKVEQLVIQQVPPTPFDSRFLVQKQVWGALTGAQQAVVVLHEALLEEAMTNYDLLKWEEIQTRGLRYFNSLVFGFDAKDVYARVTERMLTEAILSIPNVYRVELRRFGEVTGRLKWNVKKPESGYVKAIQDYDASGTADDILLLGNPFVTDFRDFHYEIGKLVFDGFFPNGSSFLSAHRVQILANGKLRVGVEQWQDPAGNSRRSSYSLRSKSDDGKMNFSLFGHQTHCYPDIEIDLHTLQVSALHAEWLDGICVPQPMTIGPVAVGGMDRKQFDLRWDALPSGGARITYAVSRRDLSSSAHPYFVLSENVGIPLILDGKQHILDVDSLGKPISQVRVFFVKGWSSYGTEGLYDPNAPESQRFSLDPMKWGGTSIKIQPQPLPTSTAGIRHLTAEPFGVLWKRKNKTQCVGVPVGTEFPEAMPSPGEKWERVEPYQVCTP